MGISSLSFVCPCMICSKRKICKENQKQKRIKMLLNMVTSVFLGNVGVIGCTSKVIIPIKQLWLCVSVCGFLISQIIIIWDTYALLLCFHTQHANSLPPLKVFWFFLLLFFFAYFSFWACHVWAYKREKKYLIKFNFKHHNFAMLKHTDVIHDWRALVVRWLFMPFF